MEKDAKELIKKCDSCQRNGRLIHKPAEELGTMFSPYPFDKWGIDIVGKFPTTPGGKKFMFVAMDYFTKWVEVEAVVKITEPVIRKFLWKNIRCQYGIPRVLISDNDAQFTGSLVLTWCQEMKIE